jgi:hypothetical protein
MTAMANKSKYPLSAKAAWSVVPIVLLCLSGCTKVQPGSLPGVRQKQACIQQAYCDNTLKVAIKVLDRKLLACPKLSVTFENAASDVLSDLDIKSAKMEIKPNTDGQKISFTIPLTNQFRPGIWHISELDFYDAKTKSWLKYKEGQDFAGIPIKLVNLSELPPAAKELEVENIEISQ